MSASNLAVATASAYPDANPDDAGLIDALGQLGLNPALCVWNDSTVDWSAYDAVLIRTIWDYFMHYPAYLGWLDHLDRLRVPAFNDTALQRWNSDKRYLLELAGRGVDIVPTQVASRNDLRDVLDPMTGQDVVVKPTVSATAWRAVKGTVDDALRRLVAELPDGDYLVQPFVSEIAEAGEWSLLFFDGRYSHAVIKRPAAGDYRVQSDFGGITKPAVPPADVLAAAEKALAAVPYRDHAYARVDGVVSDGSFLLMEIELIEPFLFLDTNPGSAERLAGVIARRLGLSVPDDTLPDHGSRLDQP